MRNPNRIDELMKVLTELWKHQPDTRFNQLIYNLQREYRGGAYVKKCYTDEIGWGLTGNFHLDLFNVEDNDFLSFLNSKLEEENKKQ